MKKEHVFITLSYKNLETSNLKALVQFKEVTKTSKNVESVKCLKSVQLTLNQGKKFPLSVISHCSAGRLIPNSIYTHPY